MTTITYRDRKIASDGQVSFGDRIEQYNLKKVRKINGCLVGGAGRLASVLQFFTWFQEWSDAQQVQGDAPHVKVFVPEGIDDEDFNGLVVFADEVVFFYEGGKKSYELTGQNYFAIGSGADFALAAMDAGASADEAIAVAINRDVYSGGEIFTEELDAEPEEITREVAEAMDKSDLISLLFGPVEENTETAIEVMQSESEEEDINEEDEVIVRFNGVLVTKSGVVIFTNPDNGEILDVIQLDESDEGTPKFNKLVKTFKRSYLDHLLAEVGESLPDGKGNKVSALDTVLNRLFEVYDEVIHDNRG